MMQSKMTVSEIAVDLNITRPKVYRALAALKLPPDSLLVDSYAVAKVYMWLSPMYIHKSVDLLKRTLNEFKQVQLERDKAVAELHAIKYPLDPSIFEI